MKIMIQQGRVIDPKQNIDNTLDLYLENASLVSIGKPVDGFVPDKVYDAKGCWIMPGMVDLYAHLKEDAGIKPQEALAAAKKGFTMLFCAPVGNKATDTPTRVEKILESDSSKIDILPIAALTEALEGEKLADLTALKEAGCPIFTNALSPVKESHLLKNFYLYAASFDLKIVIFAQDPYLIKGHIHEGKISALRGLKGIPETAETIGLAQHLKLIEETGVRAHFSHLTTASGVEMIKEAKEKGLPITADCAMHHLHLTDVDTADFNPNTYVLPPLREDKDKKALEKGIMDGTLDAICSSHLPLPSTAKLAPFAESQPGISALDTFLSLGLHLVHENRLSAKAWVSAVTEGPKQAFLQQSASFNLGEKPDLIVIDPNHFWKVSKKDFLSKGHNSPFLDWTLPGKVVYTFKKGVAI